MDKFIAWKGPGGFEKFCIDFLPFCVACIDERLFKDKDNVSRTLRGILGDLYAELDKNGLGDSVQNPKSYIAGSLRNKIFDEIKKEGKQPLSSAAPLDFYNEPVYTPADIGLTIDEFLKLFQKQNKGCYKKVKMLTEGFTYRNVATELGIAIGTVHNCMEAARTFLRSLLNL